jgi:hypothetical protein
MATMVETEESMYTTGSNRLSYQDNAAKAEGLGLLLTCKIAAEEMKHVAFQRLKFSTRCSVDDGSNFMGLRSRARRLEYCKCTSILHLAIRLTVTHLVSDLVQLQRQFILICVAGLLHAHDLIDVKAKFPAIAPCFDGPSQIATGQRLDELSIVMNMHVDDNNSQDFMDAILLALDLVKSRNPVQFAALSHGLFGDHDCPVNNVPGRAHNNVFFEGALHDVFSWRPGSW